VKKTGSRQQNAGAQSYIMIDDFQNVNSHVYYSSHKKSQTQSNPVGQCDYGISHLLRNPGAEFLIFLSKVKKWSA
jgi:hypothetical protein